MFLTRNINIKRVLQVCLAALFFVSSFIRCAQTGVVSEISLSSPGNNALKVKAVITCTAPVSIFIKYWRVDSPATVYTSRVSLDKKRHSIILTNLHPATKYGYKIVTINKQKETESQDYEFVTNSLPFWLKDAFAVLNPKPENLPAIFKNGYVMLYQREVPGIIYFVNFNGEIVWYHRVDNTGFKVAHLTNKQTILSILGNSKYETSYGDQILELSLTGDTLLNLKKGTGDFKQTVHHEVQLTPDNNIVTISVEERILDLSSVGGGKNDTVRTDGIIVFNRQGKKLWHWTVFDVLDPLKEKDILKERKDWMHGNSLTYAPDGNFLISFYNNGQIWKINSKSGEVIWKFGKGGDFKINGEIPEQCHATHYVNDSTIMLFDNGISAKTSHVFKISLDEKNRQGSVALNLSLPKDAYNERMGSAYMVGDSSILICASKRNSVFLSKLDGTYLWLMNTSGISPYRAEFIPGDSVRPYLVK